jgi:holo-[acyl-carrier protein] synthase
LGRIGIDIVQVSQVRESIAAFGPRYVERIYTARVVFDTGGAPARLAARFAAKEATLKVLDSNDRGVDFRSIEIVKSESGAPRLVLRGTARDLACEAGLHRFEVSLSHDGEYATAIVLAERLVFPTNRRVRSRRASRMLAKTRRARGRE